MTAVEFLISIKQKREIDSFDFDQALKMEQQQMEISDDYIEDFATLPKIIDEGIGYYAGFIDGAKWYREQLKQSK